MKMLLQKVRLETDFNSPQEGQRTLAQSPETNVGLLRRGHLGNWIKVVPLCPNSPIFFRFLHFDEKRNRLNFPLEFRFCTQNQIGHARLLEYCLQA